MYAIKKFLQSHLEVMHVHRAMQSETNQPELKRAVVLDGYVFLPRWERGVRTDELATHIGTPLKLGKPTIAHPIVPKRTDTLKDVLNLIVGNIVSGHSEMRPKRWHF